MKLLAIPIALLLALSSARATVTINPGTTEVFLGSTTSVEIPIIALGGDAVTDLTGVVNIAGGPTVTAVSYTGSIWASAPGGYLDFFPNFPPPSATVDPNLSLEISGENVSAAGTLFTLTVDITSIPSGDYAITLNTTPGDDTKLFRSGTPVATNLLPGVLRIRNKPIVNWRQTEFPSDFNNPAAEATIWGDDADPDLDGVTNFLEFAWGTDPNSSDQTAASSAAPGLPTILSVEDSGQRYLAIAYSRNIESPCHHEEVGISSNLASWDYTETNIIQVGSPIPHSNGITEYIVKRSTTPIAADPRNFLKLRVTGTHP